MFNNSYYLLFYFFSYIFLLLFAFFLLFFVYSYIFLFYFVLVSLFLFHTIIAWHVFFYCIFLCLFSLYYYFFIHIICFCFFLLFVSFSFPFFSSFKLVLLNIIPLSTIHQTNWIASYHIDSIIKRKYVGICFDSLCFISVSLWFIYPLISFAISILANNRIIHVNRFEATIQILQIIVK